MAEIRSSASYVRQERPQRLEEQQILRSLHHRSGFDSPEATEQIWHLLETPQTVKSIARVLARCTQLDEARCEHKVEDVLSQLFDADLIEIAPDT